MKWTTNTTKTTYSITNLGRSLAAGLFLVALVLLNGSSTYAQSSIAYLRTAAVAESYHVLPKKSEHLIPFELVRGMIVMQASIEQQPGHFILDTGAPLMVINDEPKVPSRLAASFKQEIQVGETIIQDFDWAGVEERKLDALVLDISHLENAFQRPLKGMIGFNALKDYELFFNYEDQFVLRYPAGKNDLHRNSKPLHSIPFQLLDHLPVITVKIGKKKFRFGLDTGACANLVDRGVLEALEADEITALPDEEVQGLDQTVNRVKAVEARLVQVKGLDVQELKFLATDMPELHSDEGIVLNGLLGYSFLSRMKFSINYQKQRIYVWEE
ncbi:aspartyl protease family protein [Flavilitoribacter nigricans]|uniref:Aspartyl protease n=1 Tax=Flavilitoribacter nigricans (strain ATCC 23147 / DSM 23189 / NBRC 102662 / NCIMB 1420 / SS-2) TaxID=1122177 RepID=A0A2D0NDC3_FLAN2|nr:pepsin/retropepsin-like aspartic protease family protein [Flavilitoribacter nigricans]PHN06514.1 hypothetical protein CRP01_09410 [Flavilitoribacter nigricans DSM 23189 = NBRC 102662]